MTASAFTGPGEPPLNLVPIPSKVPSKRKKHALRTTWSARDDERIVSALETEAEGGFQIDFGWKPGVWEYVAAACLPKGLERPERTAK